MGGVHSDKMSVTSHRMSGENVGLCLLVREVTLLYTRAVDVGYGLLVAS